MYLFHVCRCFEQCMVSKWYPSPVFWVTLQDQSHKNWKTDQHSTGLGYHLLTIHCSKHLQSVINFPITDKVWQVCCSRHLLPHFKIFYTLRSLLRLLQNLLHTAFSSKTMSAILRGAEQFIRGKQVLWYSNKHHNVPVFNTGPEIYEATVYRKLCLSLNCR
jgi:hypothetical protein